MAYYTDVYLNYKPTQRVLDKIHAKPLTSVAHHPAANLTYHPVDL